MIRNCIICGIEFSCGNNQICCSDACMRINKLNKQKKYKRSKSKTFGVTYHLTCVVCGSNFKSKCKIKLTCSSECNKIRRKLYKKEQRKIYYHKNKTTINKKSSKWARDNKDRRNKYMRQWVSSNLDWVKNYHKIYRIENRNEIIKFRRNNYNKRIKEDIKFKFDYNIRQSFQRIFKKRKKFMKTYNYFEYTFEEFKIHIENLFQEGMTWNNWTHDGWHLDHKRPLSSFNFFNEDGTENIEEIRKAWSLDNLQPLWAKDNLSKGNKIV